MKYKRTIFPEYDLIDQDNFIDIFAYVRKKHKGVWYLIPVRTRYEFNKDKNIVQVLTSFMESCYRVLMLYIIEENKPTDWILCSEIDIDQRDEKYRLKHYLNFNIEVL